MAEDAAAWLILRWGLADADAHVVGSVRRQRPDVGDLEIVAPWETAASDSLFRTLDASRTGAGGLFEKPRDLPPITPVSGLKPAFLECSLVASVRVLGPDTELDLPVQIGRFKPGQRAWKLIMRTGPGEFGKWFLGRWKRAFGIPPERQASIDGYLVDGRGEPVLMDDEAEAFDRCGVPYLAPEKRDTLIDGLRDRGDWHG
jgi:hypothetical protein